MKTRYDIYKTIQALAAFFIHLFNSERHFLNLRRAPAATSNLNEALDTFFMGNGIVYKSRLPRTFQLDRKERGVGRTQNVKIIRGRNVVLR